MKYPGGLAFLGLLAASGMREPGPRGWRRFLGRDMLAAAALAVVGFFLGTPFALLTPGAFVRGVLDELREVHTVQFGNEADAPGFLFHLAYSLPEAMGWPVYLLALGGLAWALARRGAREVVLLAFAVPYLLVIVTWSSRFERYVLPLLPCFALLAAVAVVRGVAALGARGWLGGSGRGSPSPPPRRCSWLPASSGWPRTIGCWRGRTRACSAPAGSSARCRRGPASPSSRTASRSRSRDGSYARRRASWTVSSIPSRALAPRPRPPATPATGWFA